MEKKTVYYDHDMVSTTKETRNSSNGDARTVWIVVRCVRVAELRFVFRSSPEHRSVRPFSEP